MQLTTNDWTIIAGYFLFNLGIGLYYSRRARGSTSEFFLSGRGVPWWLAGTSMVATTFAADTPLAVTGFVAKNGIAGNWLWWNFVMSGMMTVFLYARLWRRAGVMTVGGIDALKAKITALDAATGQAGSRLAFFPEMDSAWMPAIALFVYLAVNWWATWYPGAEPGGGGYIAQRIFSAKDEKHGLFATLWFNIAHYALRPWPWILTALASLILYPELADKETGYIRTLMDPAVFPPYLRGFMLAALGAAYMSTIGTQLNWGASYVINDFYRRFVVRDRSERHYVIASQIVTLLLMVISLIVT